MDKWICTDCGWIYDREIGAPEGKILAETPFEFIPCDWRCPSCGARKAKFEPLIGLRFPKGGLRAD
ncbi:MAG: rubredoxin [Myxococcales bacterium]|nr:MAG: rubredoxin [Myxococcales bacterium]